LDRVIRAYKCNKVFIDVTFFRDYNRRWINRTNFDYPINPYTFLTDKLNFAEIPVYTYTALQNTPARIIFKEDPGDTVLADEKYYTEFTVEPLQLTSETIPLMVAQDWEAAIIDGSLGYIEYYDYGRSDRLTTFHDYWAPKFWDAENENAMAQVTSTPVRFA